MQVLLLFSNAIKKKFGDEQGAAAPGGPLSAAEAAPHMRAIVARVVDGGGEKAAKGRGRGGAR